MRKRVVVKVAGTDVKFWTGTGWTDEYPDAVKYGTIHKAIAAWAKAPGAGAVVADYGLNTQETERT